MGKRIIQQRRGRGTMTYRANSHRWKGKLSMRVYDTKEQKELVKGTILDLIHCPGHSAPLAKVKYETGETVLMSAPLNVRIGDEVESGLKAKLKAGSTLPLAQIPDGSIIYNLELNPGAGPKLCRASGCGAKLVNKTGDFAIIKLPSKKEKKIKLNCRATLGEIAGGGRPDKPFVKAGTKMHAMRAKNKLYPKTSGVAMNAVDHPFGSGRGRKIKQRIPPRNAPPGRNVGLIRARRTGKRK